jgi:hypothetical protein
MLAGDAQRHDLVGILGPRIRDAVAERRAVLAVAADRLLQRARTA